MGPGFDDAQIHWMHADPRGTVELETDSKGEVLSQIAYFPTGEFWYGGASGARGPPTFRFQGKEREGSTGLYAFGKRHYEPRLGLWLSPDPAFPEYFTTGLSGGMHNPRNLGLYSYVWNNPLRFVDPDGRAAAVVPVAVALVVYFGTAVHSKSDGHGSYLDFDSYLAIAMDAWDALSLGQRTAINVGFKAFGSKVFGWLPKGLQRRISRLIGRTIHGGGQRRPPRRALETAREQLRRRASDPRMKDVIEQLYRKNARLGNGSAMDAYRIEGSHLRKIQERRVQLQRLLDGSKRGRGSRNGMAPLHGTDRELAQEVLRDIDAALQGKPRPIH